MKKALTLVASLLFVGAFAPAYAQSNSKSQAGGLPALAAEVAQLRAMVEALQEQVGETGDPYAGTYAVTLVETGFFGCGTGNVPNPPQPLFPYLVSQGTSSISSRTATFDVESDGSVISVPEYVLLTNELRLSGKHEEELRIEGGFDIIINADGSLTYSGDAEAVLNGQLSADGSLFSILVHGLSDEVGCADSYSVSITGVKK